VWRFTTRLSRRDPPQNLGRILPPEVPANQRLFLQR
jgi:hypothetical protein